MTSISKCDLCVILDTAITVNGNGTWQVFLRVTSVLSFIRHYSSWHTVATCKINSTLQHTVLPIVLIGRATGSMTLRMSEYRMLKKISEVRRLENLHNEELRSLSSSNIIRMIKWKGTWWAGHRAQRGKTWKQNCVKQSWKKELGNLTVCWRVIILEWILKNRIAMLSVRLCASLQILKQMKDFE
jgi:hypothetical protein